MESSRDKILNKLKQAKENNTKKIHATNSNDNYYTVSELDLIHEFKEKLENVDGKAFICNEFNEFKSTIKKIFLSNQIDNVFCLDKQIQNILEKAEIPFTENESDFLNLDFGVTGCEFLSARTGSVIISSKSGSGRRLNVYPNTHIVIANKNQILGDLNQVISSLKEKHKNNLPSQITNITGPSRTADIEKTLILGAHGPKELIVLILNY